MSSKERQRLKVLEQVVRRETTLTEAASRLNMSYRQAIRTAKRYKAEGDAGLVHRLRGKPSGRAIDGLFKVRVLDLYQTNYGDFGPTLASETLWERHGLRVHPETLRLWLTEAGHWKVRTPKGRHRTWRERKASFGELVQMDGSIHDWFEGHSPRCFLMSMVDDATGTTALLFAEQETTRAAMDLLEAWVRRYGVPRALYVDRKTVYVVDREPTLEEQLEGKPALSQFGRACDRLGIQIIAAHSPQAKGRVERKHGVCQDRLVKQMRIAGVRDIDSANTFLEQWQQPFNEKFARQPRSSTDLHQPLDPSLDLRGVFCIENSRSVGCDWTVQYHGRFFQILRQPHLPKARARIRVQEWADGSIHILHQGSELRFTELPERPRKPAPVKQASPRVASKPAPGHPWRQSLAKPPDVPPGIYKPTPRMLEDLAETYPGQSFLQSLTEQL